MITGFLGRRSFAVLLCGVAPWAVLASAPKPATAEVNCESIPAGPARTDCYIGLGRIYQQKSDIAAGTARQQTDAAIYRQVTSKNPSTKRTSTKGKTKSAKKSAKKSKSAKKQQKARSKPPAQ
jgi:hypothetical protein